MKYSVIWRWEIKIEKSGSKWPKSDGRSVRTSFCHFCCSVGDAAGPLFCSELLRVCLSSHIVGRELCRVPSASCSRAQRRLQREWCVSFVVLGHAVYHRSLIPCCSVVCALCCRALCCVFPAPRRFHSQNPCVVHRTLCAFPHSCASGGACHSKIFASQFLKFSP